MDTDNKLMEMLTGYAASHQHPMNVFVHMIGIPTIMFGALIPLCWVSVDVFGVSVNLAHVTVAGFFLFYLTLDALFAIVFLVAGMAIAILAGQVAALPTVTASIVAAACFFGGYLLQFIGHAIEKSMPVLVKHPVQANLAAPFFTVVELFKMLGLREGLFDEVQRQIRLRREQSVDA